MMIAWRSVRSTHRMMIAWRCVRSTHKMMNAWRCVCPTHTVMLSLWVHRVKERACQRKMIAWWWCVCPTHTFVPSSVELTRCLYHDDSMKIASRCVCPTHTVKLTRLCSPNEHLGGPTEPFRRRFRSTFKGCEYHIWAKNRWKLLRKRTRQGFFGLQKSSFRVISF